MKILLLILAMIGDTHAQNSSIDATIRGTPAPLEAELLLRDASENWTEVAHKTVPTGTRRVRFDGLDAGIYQLRIHGAAPTEQLATKIVLGRRDTRRTTIDIVPFDFTGTISLGGTHLAGGAVLLHHKEFGWKTGIAIGDDGTYRAPLWQRGQYRYTIRNPALATSFADFTEIGAGSPVHFSVDIPDGRITGIVTDAKTGAAVPNVLVTLQTKAGDTETNVRLNTDTEGRFDFTGMKSGHHTLRFISSAHLDPKPVEFELNASMRLKEVDMRLDPGRTIPIVVVGSDNEPVANAVVFAVANAQLRSRTTTDATGKTTAAVPVGEPATLFVIPASGAFGVHRLPREHDGKRVWVHLPRAASSLLIRAQTTDGKTMPPFSLLMRYDGTIVPIEIADELTSTLGLQLATGDTSEALLQNIPSGSYEFWPYRTEQEAEAIIASGDEFAAPIHVNVRAGENKIAVKFAAR
ncbi:MAG TPA: carboxypeptidase-like regulatory domain-containing protein [Thermoanaerobaculia bacterium]|jgi:5-hydroxyisourate hydrolase-like protein (transthyretin family)|nr:carboxypeptidase-like regulatory domain-containing protein [Thermoanaerobaculia bacterium]